jgi:CRISPR-associated protein Csb2
VAKRMRDVFLKTASDNGLSIPTLLSGHDNEGRATREPHVAIVPLADVGWNYSQGRLMGIALVWPRQVADADRRIALQVIAAFLSGDNEVGLLHFGRQGSWSLGLEPESTRASLRFARYIRAAQRWGTVLPAALDRHPKDKPAKSLPRSLPMLASTSACRRKRSMAWTTRFTSTHRSGVRRQPSRSVRRCRKTAHIAANRSCISSSIFRRVRGPLILGAGRFRGLGLCLPLDEEWR